MKIILTVYGFSCNYTTIVESISSSFLHFDDGFQSIIDNLGVFAGPHFIIWITLIFSAFASRFSTDVTAFGVFKPFWVSDIKMFVHKLGFLFLESRWNYRVALPSHFTLCYIFCSFSVLCFICLFAFFRKS